MTWLVVKVLGVYWKSIFLILYPLLLLPIVLVDDNKKETRCLYAVSLIFGYWLFDIVPAAITGLIPTVLFPLMGIFDKTSNTYLSSVVMFFIGASVVGLTIERSNLHKRIFLFLLQSNFGFRRLHFLLVGLTTFLSMWIPNTKITTMMTEVLDPILTELEASGLCRVYKEQEGEEVDEEKKQPSELAMCFYVTIVYAAIIGGIGSLIGTPTNLVLLGVYQAAYKTKNDISFTRWIASNILIMFCLVCFTCFWLQIWYLGLFRPNSQEVETIKISGEDKDKGKEIIKRQLDEMGSLTAYEVLVVCMMIVVALLLFFQSSDLTKAWPTLITQHDVGPSSCVMIVLMFYFVLPSSMVFLHAFSKDESKRPTAATPPLMVWRYIHRNMMWDVVFIIGGAISITYGIITSGVDKIVQEHLEPFIGWPKYGLMALLALIAILVTQLTRNTVVASITLPFLPHLAKKINCHPVYIMMPVCLACSFSYCFPKSLPYSMQGFAKACHRERQQMVKAGFLVMVVSYLLLIGIFPFLSPLIWDYNKKPPLRRYVNRTFV